MAVAETVDRRRVGELTERELARFLDAPAEEPGDARAGEALDAAGRPERLDGRPVRARPHPHRREARVPTSSTSTATGYLDMNIADTSTFCGNSPEPVVRAVAERIAAGVQFLMPTEDAAWVAEELARRWALPKWRFTLSATFANTEAIRVARHLTGRPKLLMFDRQVPRARRRDARAPSPRAGSCRRCSACDPA